MKNRGYAISAIIYPLLLVCLALILSIIYNLSGKYELLSNIKKNLFEEEETISYPAVVGDITSDASLKDNSYDATFGETTTDAKASQSTYNATGTKHNQVCSRPLTITSKAYVNAQGVQLYNCTCSAGHSHIGNSTYCGGGCDTVTGTTTTYSCPNGGTLSGTTCTVTTYTCDEGTLDGTTCKKQGYTCPNGGTLNGTKCVKQEYTCNEGTLNGTKCVKQGYTCPKGGILNGTTCILKNQTLKDAIFSNNSIIQKEPTLTTTSSESGDESGLYYSTNTNSGNPTYYFRGNVNNYVSFAGYTWRIIRINEDGTVRMIMTEGINNNTGYAYVNDNADNYLASYYTNSDAKKELDSWYNNKLINYDAYISQEEYCEAAKVRNDTTHAEKLNNVTLSLIGSYNPTFKCENDANNYGIVKSKIGLITVDEVIYAGGYADKINLDYYLNMSTTKHILTMSPVGLRTSSNIYDIWFVRNWNLLYSAWSNQNGYLSSTLSNEKNKFYISSLVPVINIYSTLKVTGTGTKENPYTIVESNKNSYLVSNKDSKVLTFTEGSGKTRDFYKSTDESSLAGICTIYFDNIKSTAYGPLFVSTSETGTNYYTSDASLGTVKGNYSFRYKGINWYVSAGSLWYKNSDANITYTNLNDINKLKNVTQFSSEIDCAKAIIDLANKN